MITLQLALKKRKRNRMQFTYNSAAHSTQCFLQRYLLQRWKWQKEGNEMKLIMKGEAKIHSMKSKSPGDYFKSMNEKFLA